MRVRIHVTHVFEKHFTAVKHCGDFLAGAVHRVSCILICGKLFAGRGFDLGSEEIEEFPEVIVIPLPQCFLCTPEAVEGFRDLFGLFDFIRCAVRNVCHLLKCVFRGLPLHGEPVIKRIKNDGRNIRHGADITERFRIGTQVFLRIAASLRKIPEGIDHRTDFLIAFRTRTVRFKKPHQPLMIFAVIFFKRHVERFFQHLFAETFFKDVFGGRRIKTDDAEILADEIQTETVDGRDVRIGEQHHLGSQPPFLFFVLFSGRKFLKTGCHTVFHFTCGGFREGDRKDLIHSDML